MRNVKYILQAALFAGLMLFFRALPLETASALGGWLGGRLGRHLKTLVHVARVNLALAFPQKSVEEREAILSAMWAHLGRLAGEFPHLPGNALLNRISYEGLHHLPPPGQVALFVSGHFGNWELTYPTAFEHGVPITLIYRHANNPWIDRIINRVRLHHASNMFPKGIRGASRMAHALKNGESLALLIDQKMNEGVAVPFFGHDAMTAPAIAQLAVKYGLAIIPARVVRTRGAHFRATAFPPLAVARSGDEEADTKAVLLTLHKLLEEWIRERPEQWLWIHRRWPKEFYNKSTK